MNIFEKLTGALLPWYEENKRELPWRQDKDPYHIWLSEIMLQQTRVEAVKGYYARFLAEIPSVSALANADDELLQKLWEGLGYYSRVRNLKKAAQKIEEQHGGKFPETYDEILALPGIGPYTAGAICSIAFGKPTPAVDGNVLRVIARLTDDDTPIDTPAYQKQVREALAKVYPAEAGAFTQALMELGATVCGPNRKPDCESCPCNSICKAKKSGRAESLPVKSPKKDKKLEKKTVFILRCGDCYALEKRPDTGLLASLWQFPNLAGHLDTQQVLSAVKDMTLRPVEIEKILNRQHIFTHIRWEMRGVYMEVKEAGGEFSWFTAGEIRQNAALPTAFRQFFELI